MAAGPGGAAQRQAEAQKEAVLRQWEELWGFLEEQKRLLVGWLDRLAQDIAQREEEERLSGAPAETPLPCKRSGEAGQRWRSGRALQGATSPRIGEDAPFLKPGGDGLMELEQRLGGFSGRRATLQEVLSDFRESLRLEVQKLTVLTITELEMAARLDDAEESGVKGLPVSEGGSRRSPPPPETAERLSENEEGRLQPEVASPWPLSGSAELAVPHEEEEEEEEEEETPERPAEEGAQDSGSSLCSITRPPTSRLRTGVLPNVENSLRAPQPRLPTRMRDAKTRK
ncbi:hypothetical protein lerEdw1_021044, partial [Lerista edwardsae]